MKEEIARNSPQPTRKPVGVTAKLQITSLNSHFAEIYTGTRYASIYVEKKKCPH
jgi:hypothetical protein